MQTVYTAERLWDGTCLLDHPMVIAEDGLIVAIEQRAATAIAPDAHVVDFAGATLGPAFFDVHIHGAAGHDVMEGTAEALSAVGGLIASHGTGSFLATTVTAPLDTTLRSLSALAKLLERPAIAGEAHAVGIHLEGPF